MRIIPGNIYMAMYQGTCITPQTIKVKIHWVCARTVWYLLEDDPKLYHTSLERFIEIVSQPEKK